LDESVAGVEMVGLGARWQPHTKTVMRTKAVRVTTVDSLLSSSAARLPIGATSGNLVLSIDAEGFDGPVLRSRYSANARRN